LCQKGKHLSNTDTSPSSSLFVVSHVIQVAHKLEAPTSPLATSGANTNSNNSNLPPRLSSPPAVNHHPDLDPMESSLITKSTQQTAAAPNSIASLNAGSGLKSVSKYVIHDLQELRTIFPQLFKTTSPV